MNPTKQEILDKFVVNFINKTEQDQITPENLVESLTEILEFQEPIDLSGKADLVNGTVPANQLPSYVDDIIEGEFIDSTTFNDPTGNPIVLETGKIYIDTATNSQYRWSGSILVSLAQDSGMAKPNYLVVGVGAISHTPSIGDPVNYYNDINSALTDINNSELRDAGFVIFLKDAGEYIINDSFTLKDLNIVSSEDVVLKLNSSLTISGLGKIYIPKGTIRTIRGATLFFNDDMDLRANLFEMADEGADVFTLPIRTNSSQSRTTSVRIFMDVNTFNINESINQSTNVLGDCIADFVDVKINKINITATGSGIASMFTGKGRRFDEAKTFHTYRIGEIQSINSDAGFSVFSLGYTSTDLSVGSITDVGTYNIFLGGEFSDPNNNRFIVFICRAGNFNVFMNNLRLSSSNAQMYQPTFGEPKSHRFNFKGVVEATNNNNFPFFNLDGRFFNDAEIKESFIVFEGTARMLGNGNFIQTSHYKSGADQSIPIFIKDSVLEGASDLIWVRDRPTSPSTTPTLNTLLTFLGHNEIVFTGGTPQQFPIRFDLNPSAIGALNLNVLNGTISHNAVNDDYTDERAFKSKRTELTHKIPTISPVLSQVSGTFNPTFLTSQGTGSYGSSSISGHYIKTGSLVYFNIAIGQPRMITAPSNFDPMIIGNLPFNIRPATTGGVHSLTIGRFNNISNDNASNVKAWIAFGNEIQIRRDSGNSDSIELSTNAPNGTSINISGVYTTDE